VPMRSACSNSAGSSSYFGPQLISAPWKLAYDSASALGSSGPSHAADRRLSCNRWIISLSGLLWYSCSQVKPASPWPKEVACLLFEVVNHLLWS
jgi:hypothetical protein